MSVNLNDFVIDYYVLSDIKIRKKLNFLNRFIGHIDQPFDNHSQEKWSKTHVIAKIALIQFHFLEGQTQKDIFHIAQKLAETNFLLCHDPSTRREYQAVVDTWTGFNYLQTAINQMSIFLTPAYASHPLSIQELDRAQCLIHFAVQYFKSLKRPVQMHIVQMAHLVKIPPLPNLQESPHAQYYQKLVHLFHNPLPPISQTPSLVSLPILPLTWKEDSSVHLLGELVKKVQVFVKPELSEDEFTVTPLLSTQEKLEDEANCEKERKERESIRKLQLDKICNLSQEICQHYLPLSWLGTDFQQRKFIEEFGKHLPEVAKKVFFPPPSYVSESQFQIIYQCLSQATQFLKIINTKASDSKPLTSENLHQSLIHILEKFFQHWQPEQSSLNAFVSLITTHSCIQLIERFFHPDNLYFILERLLHPDPWDLEDFNQQKIPLEAFVTDDQVTRQLGDALESFGCELIILGHPQWSANVAAKAILGVMKVKKYEIAQKIQQFLHQTKSLPCSMIPLLIIHRLLFNNEQNIQQPTWFKWQNLSAEDKSRMKQEIESKLEERLYKIILKEIRNQSQVASWMIDQTSSIKTFCQTLTQSLWQLCQKDENIKLLTFYLLQGVEKAYAPVKN